MKYFPFVVITIAFSVVGCSSRANEDQTNSMPPGESAELALVTPEQLAEFARRFPLQSMETRLPEQGQPKGAALLSDKSRQSLDRLEKPAGSFLFATRRELLR